MEDKSSNYTFSFTLQIAKFDVPSEAVYAVFCTGAFIYLFSVFSNAVILALIVTQQSLHKPMFYIMFSLPLADLLGITAALPRLLIDIVTQSNVVYYPTCVLQGFILHSYGGSVLFILAVMAFDRYIAICKPLRYHSIMTPFTVRILIASAWGLDLAFITVLFALQARLPKCNTFIVNVYCSNMALLQLSCGDNTVNNVYGLALTGLMQSISVIIQLLSYIQILKTCILHSQGDAISKALHTCLAQVITFIVFEITSMFSILAYRFQNISPNALKFSGIMIFTVLPVVNPIIYGLKAKDIRNAFIMVLKKKKNAFI